MYKSKYLFLSLVLLFALPGLRAQEIRSFSLQEALDYAMTNNYDIMKSEKDIEIAKKRVTESTAMGLPQINGSIDYTDNFARPTMIMPPEFSPDGQPLEIQFGTKYDAALGASISQLVFSGEYLVGLKASKKYLETTNVDFFKNKVAVKQQVANSYYAVLTTKKGLEIIDTTLRVTRGLAEETRQIYEVGFSEDLDVDQMELLVSDLEASKLYFESQLKLTHAYLKFYLGLNNNDSIILEDNLEALLEKQELSDILLTEFNVNINPDYYSLLKQKELQSLQINLEKASFMPTLNANVYYRTQAQRDVWNFFVFDDNHKWYNSSALGVNLSIPIFSSGMRSSKLKQARLVVEQMEIMENQLEDQLNLQYDNLRTEYINTYKVYVNKNKNRKIAEKIYLKTTEKYKQGLASSLDILNTHNQFLNAERDYLSASQAFLQSGEELKKILTETVY